MAQPTVFLGRAATTTAPTTAKAATTAPLKATLGRERLSEWATHSEAAAPPRDATTAAAMAAAVVF